MTSYSRILETAIQRGQAARTAYQGAVTPAEAYALLESHPNAKLIDVRTNAERDWVGRVVVPEARHGAVQWNLYPGGSPNPDFVPQLEEIAGKDDILLFLCRSGVRSRHAAQKATGSGFAHCFDILEGFEGDKNEAGHRKTRSGWCHAGLPWIGA